MKGHQQLANLLAVLLFCSLFIFSSAYFGSQAFGFFAKITSHPSSEPAKVAGKPKNQSAQAEKVVLNSASVKFDRLPEELQSVLISSPQIDIPSQASFSLIDFAKKHRLNNQDSAALSLLASAIYQAVLPTNFTMDEREIGTKLPAYTKLGFETKVDLMQNLDFSFSNPNPTNYLLDIKLMNHRLTVILKGAELPYTYQIVPLGEQHLKSETILQYSPLLLPGQTKTAAAGTDGQVIRVYKLTYQGGKLVKTELVSTDYYPPVYRVEIHSLMVTATQKKTSSQATAPAGQTPQQHETNTQTKQQQASSGQKTGISNQQASSGQQAGTSNQQANTTPNRSKTGSQTKHISDGQTGAGNPTNSDDSSLWGKPIEAVK